MTTTHTPGPWYADKMQDRTAFNIFMPGYPSAGAQVYHCSNATGCMGPEVAANAALIAAAPDLLAALREARVMVHAMTGVAPESAPWNALLPRIDAAIARATVEA